MSFNPARQVPLGLVLLVAGAGLVVIATAPASGSTYKLGLYVVAGALLLAAVLRAVLPTRRVGLLEARSRPFDVVLLLVVASALVAITWSLPATGG